MLEEKNEQGEKFPFHYFEQKSMLNRKSPKALGTLKLGYFIKENN